MLRAAQRETEADPLQPLPPAVRAGPKGPVCSCPAQDLQWASSESRGSLAPSAKSGGQVRPPLASGHLVCSSQGQLSGLRYRSRETWPARAAELQASYPKGHPVAGSPHQLGEAFLHKASTGAIGLLWPGRGMFAAQFASVASPHLPLAPADLAGRGAGGVPPGLPQYSTSLATALDKGLNLPREQPNSPPSLPRCSCLASALSRSLPAAARLSEPPARPSHPAKMLRAGNTWASPLSSCG